MASESVATRLDAAIDLILARRPQITEPALRDVVEVAAAVHAAHPLIPPGTLFEERLAARLRRHARLMGAAALPRALAGIRSHPRLLVAGAVGSAAVSVAGVTAIAMWRAAHPGRPARS